MSRRPTRVIVICEDILSEAFLRRFLTQRGDVPLRVMKPTPGGESGAAFVIREFAKEARTHRSRATSQRGCALLAMVDADNLTTAQRREQMLAQLPPPRETTERIALFVPKWEIETWIEYLLNGGPVDESRQDYEKYRKREKSCHPAADKFLLITQTGDIPSDCPPSLRETLTSELPRLP